MPDNLLRYLSGPRPYSWWWLVIAGLLVAAVIGWYAAASVWTLPPHRLRKMRVIGAVHSWLLRRRFARSVSRTRTRYASGGLTAAQAGAEMSRTLRSYLSLATGEHVQYMHLTDIAAGRLAPAASVIGALNEVQFNLDSPPDVDSVGRSAEKLIESWT